MMTPYYDEDGITIYHGDCREVLPGLDTVDLLITDPPYGVEYVSQRSGHVGMVGDSSTETGVEGCRLALKQLRLNRHFYVFGPFHHDLAKITTGATLELIWDEGKPGGGDTSLPWGNSHEHVTFGVWNPYRSQAGVGASAARLRRGTVLRHPTVNNGRGAQLHPTRKPVPILREFIESSSHIGEMVLDPFMGSGSTLEAAQIEGRRAIGIEIEEKYCDIAVQRLAQGVLAFGGEGE